jgi:hypothetical protein
MTFRLRTEDYEHLRRMAFEDRTSQQALVDEALTLLIRQRNTGRAAA